jgi:hypothetical protein
MVNLVCLNICRRDRGNRSPLSLPRPLAATAVGRQTAADNRLIRPSAIPQIARDAAAAGLPHHNPPSIDTDPRRFSTSMERKTR